MDPPSVFVVCFALFVLVVPVAVFRHPARFRAPERISFPPMEPWPTAAATCIPLPDVIPDMAAFAPTPNNAGAAKRISLIVSCEDDADAEKLKARLARLESLTASVAGSSLGLTAYILLDQARTHLKAAQSAAGNDEAQEALRHALAALAGAEATIDPARA